MVVSRLHGRADPLRRPEAERGVVRGVWCRGHGQDCGPGSLFSWAARELWEVGQSFGEIPAPAFLVEECGGPGTGCPHYPPCPPRRHTAKQKR